jgi:4-hydroxy-4-methyl-2-oxoglutarate aldolase
MSGAPPPSTASVASVADGAARRIIGLTPVAPAARLSGPAATCRCAPGDNLALHLLLATTGAGSVLVCDAGGRVDCGHFGELMATDARNRGFAGLVIDGAVRDGAALRELGFPVFHRGFAPGRCAKSDSAALSAPVELSGVRVTPGDMLVADRDGVLVVPRADWDEIRSRAERLDAEEASIRQALERGERLAGLIGVDVPEDRA